MPIVATDVEGLPSRFVPSSGGEPGPCGRREGSQLTPSPSPMRSSVVGFVLFFPFAAAAQTGADAQLCERFVATPSRLPAVRAQLQTAARGADVGAAQFAQGCLAVADARWDDAAKAFERSVKANERSADAHYWLGRAYAVQVLRANVLRQASLAGKTRGVLERAVQLDPDHLDARAALMQYYLRAPGVAGGSVAKARQQAEEVRRRNAYRGGILAATIARREKQWAAAVAEYERLIKQHPDSAAPYSSLASTYGDHQRWTEAFATVDRFRAAMPNEILVDYALGRAAAESGQQLDRGEAGLRKYIASATPAPGEPTIATAHLRLGALLERRGNKPQARVQYETALRLEPTLEAARTALDKLK